ncbi:MAG: molybdopterin molybdenumtransferase MoeA, partial [Pseudomonadota bacterium]|nr:molybdopterin molybdenumtransferase MoeA [Pseudomonadota bacterium]
MTAPNAPAAIFGDDYDPAALSIDEARRRLGEAMAAAVGCEWVALRSALGRVLAQDLHSPCDVPAHRASAMDGYALQSGGVAAAARAADGRLRLPVAGVAAAGHPFEQDWPATAAVRIMTGAVVPEAADTVVMQERVSRDGDSVLIA